MREIKFRFYSKILKRFVIPEDGIFVGALKDPEMEVMQFTGLKDKNGVEIYEGDIFIFHSGKKLITAKVVFEDAMFKMKDDKGWGAMILQRQDDMKVIGNIYQNLELLTQSNE